MAPHSNSINESRGHDRSGYGSIDGNAAGRRCQEEIEARSDCFDPEQMKLFVSSYHQQQHHHQQKHQVSTSPIKPHSSSNQCNQSNDNDSHRNHRLQWRQACLCILVGVLGGVLLSRGFSSLGVWQNNENYNYRDPAGKSSDHSFSGNNTPHLREFDYIVVGGGPSGIIAASRLARELPNARIVLVESGRDSQSSVLAAMEKQAHTSRKSATATVGSTGTLMMGESAKRDGASLNKYDCPLMWSAVADTQRRIQETFRLKPDPKTSPYWPVPLALLARGLGGCGLHNAMIYVRSLPSCFERWKLHNWSFEEILPVYKALETFVPNHRFTNATDNSKEDWSQHRGFDGPIRTSQAGPELDTIGKYFVEAAVASGLPMAGANHGGGADGSFNHLEVEDRVGVGYYEFNIRNGVRHSVANAMLGTSDSVDTVGWTFPEHATDETERQTENDKPDGIPPNLLVLTGCTVTEVVWSKPGTRIDSKPRALGVNFLDNESGNRNEILLRQASGGRRDPLPEVILATGAIMTPQILWNSGVGDNGSVVHSPGVGKNLQDHPVLGMAFEITPEMTQNAISLYTAADKVENYAVAAKVLNRLEKMKDAFGANVTSDQEMKEPELASDQLGTFGTAGFSVGAFLRSPWAEAESQDVSAAPPDIQLTVFPRVVEPHQPKGKDKVDADLLQSRSMLVTVALLEPEARYEVKPSDMIPLTSSSQGTTTSQNRAKTAPYSTAANNGDAIATAFAESLQYPLPSIVLPKGTKEYLTNRDVERLAWGMEKVRHIMRYPPLADSTITGKEIYPGPSVKNNKDGNALDIYIRANHLANSHWVGTTKMGHANDPLAVLDESLRVRGVRGLRVFDSGAIPFVPNGNTHSTVCAVASRGVDLILAERNATHTDTGA